MDVNTATAVSASTASTPAKSTNSTAKTSEKSFDEEMKTVSKNEDSKSQAKDEKSTEKTSDKKAENNQSQKINTDKKESEEFISSDIYQGEVDFTDFKYHNESQHLLSMNIQDLLNTKDLMATVNSAEPFDYDVINMSDNDANFFANLVQNTDMSMKSISAQINDAVNKQSGVQQSVQVSSVLMEKLAESMKTNQPFRIDFDKDVSVIIKVNKDGSLSANFIPGDKAVEQYLRNNIDSLKQRFDEENLSYSELTYSNSREGKQQRRKKENDNE